MPRFVLVAAIDASPDAEQVIASACAFARGITATELHLVHAVEPEETEGFPVTEFHDRAMARGRGYLDEMCRLALSRAGVRVIGHLRECPAGTAILQTASSVDADLVMVGTHDRRGLSHWAFGSVSERVARDAACPVLVVRPKHHERPVVPQIEPPCPECLKAQRDSMGGRMWCSHHLEHHPHGHLHYETPEGFGAGSQLIRP